MKFRSFKKSITLFILFPAILSAQANESTPEEENHSIPVSFSITLENINEECKFTVISKDENDFITRTVSKNKHQIDLELRPLMEYQLFLESSVMGSVSNQFIVNDIQTGKTAVQMILVEGIMGPSDDIIGVKSVFANSATDEQKKYKLAQKTEAMVKEFGEENVQVISVVRFFETADEIRKMISEHQMRFDFDERAVVKYLKSSDADKRDEMAFEQLVGRISQTQSVIGTTKVEMNLASLNTSSMSSMTVLQQPVIEEKPVIEKEITVLEQPVTKEKMAVTKQPVLEVSKPSETNEPEMDFSTITAQDLYFCVQLGAYSKEISNPEKVFTTNSVISHAVQNNQVKYFSGKFQNYEDAKAHKEMLLENGKEGVFLAAFNAGEKISVQAALQITKKKNEME